MGNSISTTSSLKYLRIPVDVKFIKIDDKRQCKEDGIISDICMNTPLPQYLLYKDDSLQPRKILGYGGFGLVIEYSNQKHKFAIKITSDKEEVKTIYMLDNYNAKCKDSILRTRILGSFASKYIIGMQFMENNLSKLIDKVRRKSNLKKLEILQQLSLQLLCFKGAGLYYTDIKTDNILYDSNTKKYIFGDLGSMGKLGDTDFRGQRYEFNTDDDVINDNIIIAFLFVTFFSEFYPNCVNSCYYDKSSRDGGKTFQMYCDCVSLLKTDYEFSNKSDSKEITETKIKTIDRIYDNFKMGCYVDNCKTKKRGSSIDDSNEGYIDLKLAKFVKTNLLLLQTGKLTMYRWINSLDKLINDYYK